MRVLAAKILSRFPSAGRWILSNKDPEFTLIRKESKMQLSYIVSKIDMICAIIDSLHIQLLQKGGTQE